LSFPMPWRSIFVPLLGFVVSVNRAKLQTETDHDPRTPPASDQSEDVLVRQGVSDLRERRHDPAQMSRRVVANRADVDAMPTPTNPRPSRRQGEDLRVVDRRLLRLQRSWSRASWLMSAFSAMNAVVWMMSTRHRQQVSNSATCGGDREHVFAGRRLDGDSTELGSVLKGRICHLDQLIPPVPLPSTWAWSPMDLR
jgi:hypothetical protein